MKRTATLAFVLLFAPILASAQSASQTQFVVIVPDLTACPALMSAHPVGGLHPRVYVHGGAPADVPGLRLQLTLSGWRSAKIVKATVTVHGLNGKTQAILASNSLHGSAEITKTLNLILTAGVENTSHSQLVLPGFTSVRSIVLESVTYADGSTWKPAASRVCRVAPDTFMLVSAQQAAPAP